MRTALQHYRSRLKARHQEAMAADDTRRARAIWRGLSGTERSRLDPAFQSGYRSWIFGELCKNPYQLESDAWIWAAFQMGWQHAQEQAGGR